MQRLADHSRIVDARNDRDRRFRALDPEIEKARKPVRPRHHQVEKDQVRPAAHRECAGGLVQGAGLGDLAARRRALHSLAEGKPEKGVVVGNQNMGGVWHRPR